MFSCSTSRFFYSTPSRIPRFDKQTWLFLALQIEERFFFRFRHLPSRNQNFKKAPPSTLRLFPTSGSKGKKVFFPLSLFFSASFSPPLSKVGERSSKKGLKERRAAAVVLSPLERRGGVASRYNPRNWGFGRRGRFGSAKKGVQKGALPRKRRKKRWGFVVAA